MDINKVSHADQNPVQPVVLNKILDFLHQATVKFLFTFSAVAAPVTAHLHTAGLTAFSEYRLVSVIF